MLRTSVPLIGALDVMTYAERGYVFLVVWLAMLGVLWANDKYSSIERRRRLKAPMIVFCGAVFLAGGAWTGTDRLGLIVMTPAVVLIGAVWIWGSRICGKCGKWSTPGYFMSRPKFCGDCGTELQ